MPPPGDHFDSSNELTKTAEIFLREAHPDIMKLRTESLFLFSDQDVALRYWALTAGRTLYRVEVDPDDILHIADMQLIRAIGLAIGDPTLPA
jgi:hypothetical protein